MITIFNRREVLTTFSGKDQSAARDALAAAGIDYSVKVKNIAGGGVTGRREHYGSAGIDQDAAYQYYIYVHKDDEDKARRVLGK